MYSHFSDVWNVKNLHMVPALPPCIFFLKCCFKKDCVHPICKRGSHDALHRTIAVVFPSASYSARLWGDNCSTRKGSCSGHYLKHESNLVIMLSLESHAVSSPPSTIIVIMLSLESRAVSSPPSTIIVATDTSGVTSSVAVAV